MNTLALDSSILIVPSEPPSLSGAEARVWPSPAVEEPATEPRSLESPLKTLFRLHRWRVLLTYALFNVENLFNTALSQTKCREAAGK